MPERAAERGGEPAGLPAPFMFGLPVSAGAGQTSHQQYLMLRTVPVPL